MAVSSRLPLLAISAFLAGVASLEFSSIGLMILALFLCLLMALVDRAHQAPEVPESQVSIDPVEVSDGGVTTRLSQLRKQNVDRA